MIDWKIGSRSASCRACETAFVDGQAYHSLLFEERQELRRTDVCQDCWDAQYSQGALDRKGFVSYWRSIFRVPPPPPPEPVRRETAESVLRQLIGRDDAQLRPVCYILAVMLERKRVLKIQEERVEEGVRQFVYEHAKSKNRFVISDPDLKLNELEAVQRDVSRLLEEGVDAFLASLGEPAAEAGPAEGEAEAAAPVEAAP